MAPPVPRFMAGRQREVSTPLWVYRGGKVGSANDRLSAVPDVGHECSETADIVEKLCKRNPLEIFFRVRARSVINSFDFCSIIESLFHRNSRNRLNADFFNNIGASFPFPLAPAGVG